MFSGRQVVLTIAGILAISLGVIGGLKYPLFGELALNVLLYGTAVTVGCLGLLIAMNYRKEGVIFAVGIIAISLAFIGSLSYPLSGDILSVLIYEILVILGILGILLLIDKRGLEET